MVFGLRIITLPKLSKDNQKVFMILVFFMKKCLTLTFHWKKAYENMRNNTRKVLGVWNDHDYGLQNGDANFSNKNVTKKVFLDFLGESRGSERREHHSGVYNSYYFGEKKRVKLILLDVRYNKQNDDILGEIQWKWLEKQLWDNDAVVTIFASGLLIKNVEDFNVYFQRNANHA